METALNLVENEIVIYIVIQLAEAGLWKMFLIFDTYSQNVDCNGGRWNANGFPHPSHTPITNNYV